MKLEYCITQDSMHIGRNVLLLSAIVECQLKIFFDGQLNFTYKDIALFLPYPKFATIKFVTLLILLRRWLYNYPLLYVF
jgi:hypothetical protein